ncbi:NAD(P)-binding protein [Xylaria intraflava]|nr:NAD(P)-binding protein [Xylaria intraflava]
MRGGASSLRQAFPGKPKFLEDDVPDLENKVIIVTGSNTGVGKEIARIVYSKNAKVYMMARSEEKTRKAMDDIRTSFPQSRGQMTYIRLDLSDLTSIKTSAQEFLTKERELHVLFNNAGVGYPEKGSRTKQGYELQLGVNILGTFSLTKHLTSTIVSTAKTSQPGTVRVVWASSSAAEAINPNTFMEDLKNWDSRKGFEQYFLSKLGNYFHATEFAARHKADGVISVSLNPGNLDSDFWRTQGPLVSCMLRKTLLYPPLYGAYTNLFAGFSREVTLQKSGELLGPWGKFKQIDQDMVNGSKTKSQGGTGTAQKFWDWSEAQIKPYAA